MSLSGRQHGWLQLVNVDSLVAAAMPASRASPRSSSGNPQDWVPPLPLAQVVALWAGGVDDDGG